MRKKNQTEKSNSFSTIKVPFVSNEIECPVLMRNAVKYFFSVVMNSCEHYWYIGEFWSPFAKAMFFSV